MEIISDNYDKAGASDAVKKVLDEKNVARNINKQAGKLKMRTTFITMMLAPKNCSYYMILELITLRELWYSGLKSPDWLVQIVKWAIDGTFKSAPHLWFQLLTIHVVLFQNCSIPALYCLLPNKSSPTYERLYKILKELAELKPELILCEFEPAQANAASAIFGCAIAYCYFHLSQNLLDKV